MSASQTSDVVIIGGGVIGLSSAYELAKRGRTVTVVERGEVGREASWAGAGMIPPGEIEGPPGLRALAKLSATMWPQLSRELVEITGIDNGYRPCGAINVSLDHPDKLRDEVGRWQGEAVEVTALGRDEIRQQFPLVTEECDFGIHLPTMGQVRNPRHLQALRQASEARGVVFVESEPVVEIRSDPHRIQRVVTTKSEYSGSQFLLTAGAWTTSILGKAGIDFEVQPVRGQIVLMKSPEKFFDHLIEDGARYIVPRDDGHILIGSTEEIAGFVKETTQEGVGGLIQFARRLVPKLRDVDVVRAWAGLRPKAVRGVPAIGGLETLENLYVAAGHFRDGLSQSPGTARIIADVMDNQPPAVPVEDFVIHRKH